jgi:hypothetical protein
MKLHYPTAAVLLLTGCGSAGTPAAVTRVVGADARVSSATPVCFAPPDPQASLTERAQQLRIVQICEDAARTQGVATMPFGSGQCLAATLAWGMRETGDRNAECARTWGGGAECYSTAVHLKTVKLVLSSGGQPLAETTATIRSGYGTFSAESFRSLCMAAFYAHPQALSGEQLEIPTE